MDVTMLLLLKSIPTTRRNALLAGALAIVDQPEAPRLSKVMPCRETRRLASDSPDEKLLTRMESGDVLIVTKLDRLDRNAMDVRQTVEQLAATGIRVH
jgi:G3E family GTPase